MHQIPFLNLQAQNNALRAEFEAALKRVLQSGAFVLGREVAAFEKQFAAHCGAKHAVALSSGTAALHLALAALGIGPGAEVIVPPFTFIATAEAVRYLGARPVFADINPRTYCLSPEAVAAAITPRTRAIIPVHLFGHPADMHALQQAAAARNIPLVEDAAQAHGAQYRGATVGGLGALACFSFYPTKNLGALGEGGAITTSSDALAEKLRLLRDWGTQKKYIHQMHAYNARMDAFQGALLQIKLRHLKRWNEARRQHAANYAAALAGLPLTPPTEAADCKHVFHVYNVRVQNRARVQAALARRGVSTGVVYPRPLHLQPAFAEMGLKEGAFPQAERAAREVLALPMYPELPAEAPLQVAAALREALAEGESGGGGGGAAQ